MLFLRGHHLICLHFFDGEGYNQEFIENLGRVLMRAKEEAIEISPGADNVCMACPSLKDSLCQYKVGAEEEIRYLDDTALALINLSPGEKIWWRELKELVPTIFSQWSRKICSECGWLATCSRNELFQKLNE